mmetsp:Transcript_15518/g.25891  ORF Transcript_15518/g.25891 Transcript_15518/m.25891 type:complete len:132 (+) Transcript_15518:720-1115(+)
MSSWRTARAFKGIKERRTPAASTLFDVRDAKKNKNKKKKKLVLGVEDARALHSKVSQVLYVSKRVRPESITAVACLSAWVQSPNFDDQAKLNRLLGVSQGHQRQRDYAARTVEEEVGGHIGATLHTVRGAR